MDLPNLFSNTKDLDARMCICSIISETTVQCLLLRVTAAGTKIVHKSTILVYADPDSLVVRMDEALQELGKESENINEVVFSLDAAWLHEGDLVASKKPLLHKVCTDLSLRPLGFIIQSEALVQHSVNRNAHFSAIFMVIAAHEVTINIVSHGTELYAQTVGRSADIVADLREAFARFVKEKNEAHLPGKLVCASFSLPEEEVVACQQQLLDASWGSAVPFVQTPTIDIIKPDLATSIIAEQAGESIIAPASHAAAHASHTPHSPATHTQELHSELLPTELEPADFGFSAVSTEKLVQGRQEERAVEVDTDLLPKSFGIPIKHAPLSPSTDHDADIPHARAVSPVAGGFFAKLFGKRIDEHGRVHYNPLSFIVAGLLTGFLALILIAAIWIFAFSTVSIVVQPIPKTIAKDISLTLDPSITEGDVAALKIPAKKITVELKGENSGTTTGIKIVGDKATGEVVLYNKTTGQKSFPKGTVVAQGDLQFVTTAEATVPASTEQETANQKTTTYGEVKVSVAANLIGIEGNIAKDTELTVANFDKSSYSAKAVDTFTGGSSREVRVISKEDRELLLSEVKKKLLADADTQFKAKSGNGSYVLPSSDLTITKTVYSGEVESPADTLSLKVEATSTALSYEQKELVVIAQDVLKDQVQEGYALTSDSPQILSAPAPASSSKAVTIKANISMKTLPKLDFNSLAGEVKGMDVDKAKEHLLGKKIFSAVEISFTPSFAQSLIHTLPTNTAKITFSEKK
ncbi:hypothetical protein KA082_00445 [Candidatus Woesebacteria bacterium]|nr:hypothetical protein [Candidatus Woesebacteria bacterium]